MLRRDRHSRSKRLTRRELLRLLGVSAGASLVALEGPALRVGAAIQGVNRRERKPTLAKGEIIRTVLKDLSPNEVGPGATLFHEHIASDTVDDLVIEEIAAAKKAGISCFVNAKAQITLSAPPPNIGNLRIMSMQTGMHIIACGGYYFPPSYPPDIQTKSEDQIADDLAQEAQRDRLGAFGEIGELPNSSNLTADEIKVFRAVGRAHLQTNLPIFTHSPYGTGPNVRPDAGLRQLDALESVGVNPKRVAIGHVCSLDDPRVETIKQIAKRGAFLGFDRMADRHSGQVGAAVASRVIVDISDEQLIREILELIEAGYVEQLLFADDSTAQPLRLAKEINQMIADKMLPEDDAEKMKAMLFKDLGLGRAVTYFVPLLRKAGVKEETLHTIIHDNPLRFLAFQPKM